MRVSTIVKRCLLVFVTILLFLILSLISLIAVIANGPSETLRDSLVLSAMQASATKWVPGLFLDDDLVDQIVENSKQTQSQIVDMNDLSSNHIIQIQPDGEAILVPRPEGNAGQEVDEWANAKDGMLYFTTKGTTFKAYVLMVKDPSRLYVATSSDFQSGQAGSRIFDIAEREGAVAVINGGEFYDEGGKGDGSNPMGLTYSQGDCVWDDGRWSNFFGFDKENNLVVTKTMTKKQADALGIRDGVSFQSGNLLITHEGEEVEFHFAPGNTGLAQRTAIGQRADGTVILIVTDGRTASSLGATHDDMVNLMASLGAVTAGLLDGGSSSMMYYENYYEKYDIDKDTLDSYQLKGLVNKYKAFTTPRRLPTYFIVRPLDE